MMRSAVELHDAGGFMLFRPRNCIWIAEALAALGELDQAFDFIEQALRASRNGGVQTYLAEAHRARGDLLRLGGQNAVEAELQAEIAQLSNRRR